MLKDEDTTLENLIELNGTKFVIDEKLGLWVKFEAKNVTPSEGMPFGIRYALTLHDKKNNRIMGFDNAHPIQFKAKKEILCDHWHRDELDKGRPYDYSNAGQLITDFWKEVDKIVNKLAKEAENE